MIKPCGMHVLVRKDKAPEKSEGGLFVPDVAKRLPRDAEIVAAGPEAIEWEPRLKPGAKVITSIDDRTPVEVEGETLYLMLANRHIFAIR